MNKSARMEDFIKGLNIDGQVIHAMWRGGLALY